MVSLVSADVSTMRMLIERLRWPVRMVRWRVAKEFGALLSSDAHSKNARDVYLDWLSTCEFESEVVSALAVLLCTTDDGLPSFGAVSGYLSRPSILADMVLQFIYGKTKGGWEDAHSGPVPDSFTPEIYFENHKSAHVPPILGDELHRLEKKTGLPFIRQWAFEWRKLMDRSRAPYSGYPYFFVDALLRRSEINGQFSQRQCEVYRSAFLRTLACGVSCWGMPANKAAWTCLNSLPVNKGLLDIEPVERPVWLADVPERCCGPEASVRDLVKQLITPNLGQVGMRPVCLKVPIADNVSEFSSLSIRAILVSDGFSHDATAEEIAWVDLPFFLDDWVSFEGTLECDGIAKLTHEGTTGTYAPVCADVRPVPFGFWHSDYFQAGISLPIPYMFKKETTIRCQKNHISLLGGPDVVGSWRVWHDHWTPLYAKGGMTRCGMLTEMRETDLEWAVNQHQRKLGWIVDVKIWNRATEYGEFELTRRSEFFLE